MIKQSIASRVRRSEAIEMSIEEEIRLFHGVALAGMARPAARELLERAVLLFPSDLERRGEYVRRHAIRGV